MVGLKEVLPSGLAETNLYEPMVLAWPGWKFATRDVPRGIDMYIDVLRISKEPGNEGWYFMVENLLVSNTNLKKYSGK